MRELLVCHGRHGRHSSSRVESRESRESRETDIVVRNGGKNSGSKWREEKVERNSGKEVSLRNGGKLKYANATVELAKHFFPTQTKGNGDHFYLNELDLIHRRIEHITYHNSK